MYYYRWRNWFYCFNRLQYYKKKILVFEINKNIIPVLKKNLKLNNCNYKVYSKNLSLENTKKNKHFFILMIFYNFLPKKTNKKISVRNISYNIGR